MLLRLPDPLMDALRDRLAAIPEVGPDNAPPLLGAVLASQEGSITFEKFSIEWQLSPEDFSSWLKSRYDGYNFHVTFQVPAEEPTPGPGPGEGQV